MQGDCHKLTPSGLIYTDSSSCPCPLIAVPLIASLTLFINRGLRRVAPISGTVLLLLCLPGVQHHVRHGLSVLTLCHTDLSAIACPTLIVECVDNDTVRKMGIGEVAAIDRGLLHESWLELATPYVLHRLESALLIIHSIEPYVPRNAESVHVSELDTCSWHGVVGGMLTRCGAMECRHGGGECVQNKSIIKLRPLASSLEGSFCVHHEPRQV